MNNWKGIGRLTRDPELRYSQSGVAVTTFTVAVDRRFKNAQGEKETDFIQVKTFKKLAELCSEYLAKGKLAGVSGELHIDNYTDKDGNKRWSTDIIADEVDFLSPKDGQATAPAQNAPPQYNQPPQQPPYQPPYGQQQQSQQPYPGQYGQPPSQQPLPGQYGQPPAQGYPQHPPGPPPSFNPQGYPQQPQQNGFYPPQGPQGQMSPPPNNQFGQQPPLQNHPGQVPFDVNQLGRQVTLDDDIPF